MQVAELMHEFIYGKHGKSGDWQIIQNYMPVSADSAHFAATSTLLRRGQPVALRIEFEHRIFIFSRIDEIPNNGHGSRSGSRFYFMKAMPVEGIGGKVIYHLMYRSGDLTPSLTRQGTTWHSFRLFAEAVVLRYQETVLAVNSRKLTSRNYEKYSQDIDALTQRCALITLFVQDIREASPSVSLKLPELPRKRTYVRLEKPKSAKPRKDGKTIAKTSDLIMKVFYADTLESDLIRTHCKEAAKFDNLDHYYAFVSAGHKLGLFKAFVNYVGNRMATSKIFGEYVGRLAEHYNYHVQPAVRMRLAHALAHSYITQSFDGSHKIGYLIDTIGLHKNGSIATTQGMRFDALKAQQFRVAIARCINAGYVQGRKTIIGSYNVSHQLAWFIKEPTPVLQVGCHCFTFGHLQWAITTHKAYFPDMSAGAGSEEETWPLTDSAPRELALRWSRQNQPTIAQIQAVARLSTMESIQGLMSSVASEANSTSSG